MPALTLRALAVHHLDPDERAVALAAARLPGGAAHLVARAELAAADLRCRHVDVSLRLAHPAEAQEAVALRHPVEHASDLFGLGFVHLWLLGFGSLGFRLLSLGGRGFRFLGLGDLSFGLLGPALERLDQLVAGQHAVPRNAELTGSLVQVCQM